MANRAYLLNTKILSNNEFALLAEQPGTEEQYLEIAEAAYRVPVLWMCCFRSEDLRTYAPTRAELYDDDDTDPGEVAYERLVPCTTVAAAVRNLRASRSLVEAVARDASKDPEELALDKWEDAIAALQKLPFPYLTVVVHEVVQSEEEHASFVEALRGDAAAVRHLVELSRSRDDFEVALDAGIWRTFDAAGRPLPAVTPAEADNPSWQKLWRKRASGRIKADEEYFLLTRKSLGEYARNGLSVEEIESRDYHASKMPPKAPSPYDWEWNVGGWLTSYAEALVREIEDERSRGLALNAKRAQNAFAAEFTAQMINLHRLLLSTTRGWSKDNIRMQPDTVLYTALGLVAGCEEDSLRSARMLCAAWRRPDFYGGFLRPTERFLFTILSAYLNEPTPPLVAHKASGKSPVLDILLAGGRWRNADAEKLKPLCFIACREYTYIAPEGPFLGLPIAVLLMFKLRELSGLANPEVVHSLFNPPIDALPTRVSFSSAPDELVTRVRERMGQHGYDEKTIYDAIVKNVTLPIETAAARKP